MEKYIVKFNSKSGKPFYTDLFTRDNKTVKSTIHRRRDGLKGEEFICYQGGEFINTDDNVFTQFVPSGVEPNIMYAESVYKINEHYNNHERKRLIGPSFDLNGERVIMIESNKGFISCRNTATSKMTTIPDNISLFITYEEIEESEISRRMNLLINGSV